MGTNYHPALLATSEEKVTRGINMPELGAFVVRARAAGTLLRAVTGNIVLPARIAEPVISDYFNTRGVYSDLQYLYPHDEQLPRTVNLVLGTSTANTRVFNANNYEVTIELPREYPTLDLLTRNPEHIGVDAPAQLLKQTKSVLLRSVYSLGDRFLHAQVVYNNTMEGPVRIKDRTIDWEEIAETFMTGDMVMINLLLEAWLGRDLPEFDVDALIYISDEPGRKRKQTDEILLHLQEKLQAEALQDIDIAEPLRSRMRHVLESQGVGMIAYGKRPVLAFDK